MKLSVVTAAIGAAAAMGCAPASVYIFDSGQAKHVARDAPALTSAQSELVLAEAAGTSRFHAAAGEDARIAGAFADRRLFGRRRDAVVVAVTGVRGDIFERPSYTVDGAPAGDLERVLGELAEQLQRLSGRVRLEVAEGLTLLAPDGAQSALAAAEVDGLDPSVAEELAVLRDVAKLRAVAGHAVVRLESLRRVPDESYAAAHAALQRALQDLVARDARVAVISEPHDMCRTVQLHTKRDNAAREARAASVGAPAFASKDKCEAATNGCSGRGECVSVGDRFACACRPSYDSERKKTTRWAGAACQKKDVSVEFQLFFWTGLGIVAALAWGVKLLFSIGSEPLPGVLAAAVVPKKA